MNITHYNIATPMIHNSIIKLTKFPSDNFKENIYIY